MIQVEGSIVLNHANGLAEEGRTVAETDAGKISAVDVSDGYNGTYHLQFITMEPSSLFLPVLLQSDMIIYVHTGLYMCMCMDQFIRLFLSNEIFF